MTDPKEVSLFPWNGRSARKKPNENKQSFIETRPLFSKAAKWDLAPLDCIVILPLGPQKILAAARAHGPVMKESCVKR